MGTIDPRASVILQRELMSGESVHWAGVPNPKVIFHSDDWYLIPFSLMWGGFTIFWELSALGHWGDVSRGSSPSTLMVLWGIPFVVIGQYLIWGRFVVDAWLKRRIFYGVTNRRVLVVQKGLRPKTFVMYLEAISSMERESAKTGTVWFGPSGARHRLKARRISRFAMGNGPVFADIDNVESVYNLIVNLRERASKGCKAETT